MRHIGGLIFPGFELLDLFGPYEMFGLMPDDFKLSLVARDAGAVASNQQVAAVADFGFGDAPDFDILFVPGGAGTRKLVDDAAHLEWIRTASAAAELTLSVCTGSLLLGKAGLLDGRRATTNKAAFTKIEAQVPGAHWVREARWVDDGDIVTSSGVSAGMDMALAVIAKLYGLERAEEVAMWAEYDWHTDAAHDPFASRHGLV